MSNILLGGQTATLDSETIPKLANQLAMAYLWEAKAQTNGEIVDEARSKATGVGITVTVLLLFGEDVAESLASMVKLGIKEGVFKL